MYKKTSFLDFYKDIEWFERFLVENGVNLNPSSATKSALNDLKLLADHYQYLLARKSGVWHSAVHPYEAISNEELRLKTRRGMAIASQIWLLQKCSQSEIKIIKEKINLYANGQTSLLSIEESNKSRNFAWEVFAASCVGKILKLQNFNEPDFIANADGRSVGFSCKVLYSLNPKKHARLIIEGVKQLETSDADEGFVLVNVTNFIPHNDFFKINALGRFDTFTDPDGVMDLFRSELFKIHNQIEYAEKDFNRRIVHDSNTQSARTKTNGIIYFAQTITLIDNKLALLSNCLLHIRPGADEDSRAWAIAFSDKFNVAAWGSGFGPKSF